MLRFAALLLALSGSLAAQAEAPAELVEGVTEIAAPGTPGDVCAFGPDAFVVVVAQGDAPVVAGAQAGRGRVLICGHGGYLGAEALKVGETARFYENAMRWLAGGKRKPSVACPDNEPMAKALSELGLRAAVDTPLKDADCIVLKTGGLTHARIAELTEFVERGGGIFTGATGWGWQQLNPKRTLARDLEVNRLLAPFGVVFGSASVGETGDDSLLIEPRPSNVAHAGRALEGLRACALEGDAKFRAVARVKAAMNALPDHEASWIVPLREWLDQEGAESSLVTHAESRQWRPLGERWGAWHVIGPFRGGKGVEVAQAPERSLKAMLLDGPGPKLDGTVRGLAGQVGWAPLPLATDGLDLDVGEVRFDKALTAPEDRENWTERAAAYLYRRVELETPREYSLRVGADDAVRVWCNSELIHDQRESLGIEAGESDLTLRLERGVNHLLVKVRNEEGVWGFRLKPAGRVSQEAINAAIDRGVDFLLERQLVDGSWTHRGEYGVGYSAYAVYTLLKSGVDPEHPAVRRGFAYVRAHDAEHTYTTSCKILALAAADRGQNTREIREAVDQLCGWQEASGNYAYPIFPGGGRHAPDLSNTLYAALALRAAHKRGIDPPPHVWEGLIEGTLRFWENAGSTKKRRENLDAGFGYRPGEKSTGSMTTAGVSVLAIARDALGEELDRRTAKEVDDAIASGLKWIESHLLWGENPGKNRWHYFFLYGIERVGALLRIDNIGEVNWYWSGAGFLIKAQHDDGSWKGNDSDKAASQDTILALLFLNKATAPTSGRQQITDRRVLSSDGAVSLRAIGGSTLDVWIAGFADSVLTELGKRPRVERVVYRVRDADGNEHPGAEVAGNPDGRGPLQRFEARIAFEQPGSYTIVATVTAQIPGEPGFEPERVDVESEPLSIDVAESAMDVVETYATDHERNLFRGATATVEASSHHGGDDGAKATDGKHGTRWRCAKEDATPSWRAAISPEVEADRLLLSHALPMLKEKGKPQAAVVEVVLDGGETFRAELDSDPLAKTVVPFPATRLVSSVEVRIVEVRQGALGTDAFGFSEIELVLGK